MSVSSLSDVKMSPNVEEPFHTVIKNSKNGEGEMGPSPTPTLALGENSHRRSSPVAISLVPGNMAFDEQMADSEGEEGMDSSPGDMAGSRGNAPETRRTSTISVASQLSLAPTLTSRRQSHITSEQKRRQSINDGFEELRRILPSSHGSHDSKAAILRKAVTYISQLQHEVMRTRAVLAGGAHSMTAALHGHPQIPQMHILQSAQRMGPPMQNYSLPINPPKTHHSQQIPVGMTFHPQVEGMLPPQVPPTPLATIYPNVGRMHMDDEGSAIPPIHQNSSSNLVHLIDFEERGDDFAAASLSMLKSDFDQSRTSLHGGVE